jgi:hypothetical protein
MTPKQRAEYLCERYKRALITRFNVTPSGRRKTVAVYLSFPGRPSVPAQLLWASPEHCRQARDLDLSTSKRLDWRTIGNAIALYCIRISTRGMTPNGYTHRIN